MWRSAAPTVLRTGSDLCSIGLSNPPRLASPIVARVLPAVTRPRLAPVGAANRGWSTRQFSSLGSARGNNLRCSPGRIVEGYPQETRGANVCRLFCTVVSMKPAVNVLEQPAAEPAPIPEDDSVTEELKNDPESDPWLLRHKVVTFNTGKFADRPQGVTFNAGYMDTGSDWHESKKRVTPTILAIPGQPGSHDDMLPVVRPLYDEDNHRVVIVNMPGYDFTKGLTAEDGEFYENSSTDLAEFVYSFIQVLQLERIDMVVTHSAGSIPLFLLAATSDVIRSAMIICTPSGHIPSRVSRPLWFIKGLVYTWNTPAGRSFLKWYLPKFNRTVQWLNTDDPCQLITTAKYGAHTNFELLGSLSSKICAKNKPMVYIASRNDRLVELNLSLKWAEMLGVDRDCFDVYDENYNMIKTAENDEAEAYPKGVVLAKGGHYPQRKEVALPVLLGEARGLLAHVLKN